MATTISQVLRSCPECGASNGLCKHGVKKTIDIKHLRKRSQEQERMIANKYKEIFPKARKVPMSGGIATLKGDVEVEDFILAECKESRLGSLAIKASWVDKIAKEAADAGKKWYALHAWVAEDNQHYRKVAILPEALFFEMLKELNDRS